MRGSRHRAALRTRVVEALLVLLEHEPVAARPDYDAKSGKDAVQVVPATYLDRAKQPHPG